MSEFTSGDAYTSPQYAQNYEELMDFYWQGLRQYNTDHQTALADASRLNFTSGPPQQFEFALKDRQTRIFNTTVTAAHQAEIFTNQLEWSFNRVATPNDIQVYKNATRLFNRSNFDDAYRYIDENASDNDGRRAIRTVMDANTVRAVRGWTENASGTVDPLEHGYLYDVHYRIDDVASNEDAALLLKSIADKGILSAIDQSTLWDRYDPFRAVDLINSFASSRVARNALRAAHDSYLPNIIRIFVADDCDAHAVQLIEECASEPYIRNGFYQTMRLAQTDRQAERDARARQRQWEEQQRQNARNQRRQEAPGAGQQPPRQEAPKAENTEEVRIKREVERIIAQVTDLNCQKTLRSEDPKRVWRVAETVRVARQTALDKGRTLSDKDLWIRYRKRSDKSQKEMETSVKAKQDLKDFHIINNLMGGNYKGKLPF